MKLLPKHPGGASIETNGEVHRITWLFGDLHALQEMTGDPVTFIPASKDLIEMRWLATAGNRSGRSAGTIEIGVLP